MYYYSVTQWILFFFCYCFVGWIWECSFVSVKGIFKNKKLEFVNRGFLHGPVIPIYGFAAITILLTTISVRESIVAVYIIGATTATLFELITGFVMERLFKVKYWDYSNMPLDFHGHICVFVSLFWGFLSVLLIEVIHIPLENIMFQIPVIVSEIIAFLLVALFAFDFKTSLSEAINLRDIIVSFSENSEIIKRLEDKVNAIVAFSPLSEFDKLPDRKEIMHKMNEYRKLIIEKNEKIFVSALKQLKRNPTLKSQKYLEIIEQLRGMVKKIHN